MKSFHYLSLFFVLNLINSNECQNNYQFDDNNFSSGIQISTENDTSLSQNSGSSEQPSYNESDQTSSAIEEELNATIDRVSVPFSALPQTTKTPVDNNIYVWIAIAVIYVILVVIGLIWTLKSFCKIKQSENIEDKRVIEMAAILEVSDSEPTTAPVSSNEIKDLSIRSQTLEQTSSKENKSQTDLQKTAKKSATSKTKIS